MIPFSTQGFQILEKRVSDEVETKKVKGDLLSVYYLFWGGRAEINTVNLAG